MDTILTCPNCGSINLRPSQQKGLRDALLARIALAPFRCRNCHGRFFRFSRRIGDEFELATPDPVRPVLAMLGPEEPEASILILDRDPAVRKLLRRVLERRGYRIHEVGDGGDLTSELRIRPIDLLIADLDFSREEAVQAIAGLKGAYPDLKIILLSGSGSREAFDAAAVLPKPFRAELLLERVRVALAPVDEPRVAQ